MQNPSYIVFLLLFILINISYAQNVSKDLTQILVYKKSANLSDQQYNSNFTNLKKDKRVKQINYAFSEAERARLNSIGLNHLSETLMLNFDNIKDLSSFKDQLAFKGEERFSLEYRVLEIEEQSEPLDRYQWYLHNTGEPQSLDINSVNNYQLPARVGEDINKIALPSSKKVRVAVLDTGIQRSHPDLENVVVKNPGECKALQKFLTCLITPNSEETDPKKIRKQCEAIWFDLKNPEVDTDKNGYPLDCSGWSTADQGLNPAKIWGHPDFEDKHGHGTHVAGIIAAQANNLIGTSGVSSHVEILPVQVIGENPSEPVKANSNSNLDPVEVPPKPFRYLGDGVARGVLYAILNKADIINLSLGWHMRDDSQLMREMVVAAQEKGILVVASAGNDSTRALVLPCAYSGVICVGASGPDGAMTYFSNYGTGVDIAAPGLNILSSWPESIRSIRYRDDSGYEFLSGTSQATPIVTGVLAELLSTGINSLEAKSRIIQSARPLRESLAIHKKSPNGLSLVETDPQKKFVLSGNIDLGAAFKMKPQPVIIPHTKGRDELIWDGVASNLTTTYELRNIWQDIEFSSIQLKIVQNDLFPKLNVHSIKLLNLNQIWHTGEVVKLEIKFSFDPNQLVSDVDIPVDLFINNKLHRSFIVEKDILILVSPHYSDKNVTQIPIEGLSEKDRTSYFAIDERYDDHPEVMEYLVARYVEEKTEYALLKFINGKYQLSPYVYLDVPGDKKFHRVQLRIRMDLDGDGVSEYIMGIYEDLSKSEKRDSRFSPMHFFVFNSNFDLIDKYSFDSDKVQIPLKIYWQKIGQTKKPIWVGMGYDPVYKSTRLGEWAKDVESPKLRIYYLNENNQLVALQKHDGYIFSDILIPQNKQVQNGEVSVLMMKPHGRSSKNSYYQDYAIAKFSQGKVQNYKEVENIQYRNLLETLVDGVNSLDYETNSTKGTFWFNNGLGNTQRLTLYDQEKENFSDQTLHPVRGISDSTIWVRAVFLGKDRAGAFALTQSELQYHNLLTGDVVSRSLERFTFYTSSFFTSMHYPIVLKKRNENSSEMPTKTPGLYLSESSRLSRGVKVLAPIFAYNDSVIDLVSPARLRLRADKGCRAADTAIYGGSSSGDSFDYFCGNKILRIEMKF